MLELIKIIDQTLNEAVTLNISISRKFGLSGSVAPLAGLNMAHQHLVLQREQFDFYYNIWSQIQEENSHKLARLQQENGERIVMLSKAAFILIMSAFEFTSKQAMSAMPLKLGIPAAKIYFMKIIKESSAAGIITSEDAVYWDGLVELRNRLVHNNGIATTNKVYEMPGAARIEFIDGRMTTGNLKFFLLLQRWAVGAYARWCEGFLR